jgi:hypothetical protein
LSTAGLITGYFHFAASLFQQLDGGKGYLGAEHVGQAGNEQTDLDRHGLGVGHGVGNLGLLSVRFHGGMAIKIGDQGLSVNAILPTGLTRMITGGDGDTTI